MNVTFLLGRLGADPETKTLGDTSITTFSVATSKTWTDKSGEKQEKTEWHNCKAWGKQGEVIAKYFTKGKPIQVMGEIEYRTWDKEDGSKGYGTDIKVNSFEFVPSTKDQESKREVPNPHPDVPNMAPKFDDSEDMPAF